ncbi:MAG: PilZ domain-containing protein [Terriglobales bacterium]
MKSPNVEPAHTALVKNERRHHPRYTVKVPVEVHPEGSGVPMRVETTDLSRGGCYVELAMPLHVGIRVQVTLWLADAPVVIHGRVVTRHPEFGNGIVFLDFESQAEVLLNQYLDAVIAAESY